MKPLVIKLGGSLAESGQLKGWLSVLARARRPVVVVPGGGPFADAVREAQPSFRYDDETAHRMALLAMHQMALAMIASEPRLVAAETLAEIERTARGRRIPIWMPERLADADKRIPRDWTITGDGLAARLAERLCTPVVLVKSCIADPSLSARALAKAGVVDRTFATIVNRAGLTWQIVGPGEQSELAELVDAAPGTKPRPISIRRRALGSTRRPPRGRARASKVK